MAFHPDNVQFFPNASGFGSLVVVHDAESTAAQMKAAAYWTAANRNPRDIAPLKEHIRRQQVHAVTAGTATDRAKVGDPVANHDPAAMALFSGSSGADPGQLYVDVSEATDPVKAR